MGRTIFLTAFLVTFMSTRLIQGRKYRNETKLFPFLQNDDITKWNYRYLKSRLLNFERAVPIDIHVSPSLRQQFLEQCQSKVGREVEKQLKKKKRFWISKMHAGNRGEIKRWVATLEEDIDRHTQKIKDFANSNVIANALVK